MDASADCEAALVAHWSPLGRLPGGTLHDDGGLVWFETPVRHLPYNGVVRTQLTGEQADGASGAVVEHVRGRGAELWWVAHPTAAPSDLGERLARAGLRPVERMSFMALDLTGWTRPPEREASLMAWAKEAGCHRAVLHATDMAVGVYLRAGFERCGEATVHATAPPWSD